MKMRMKTEENNEYKQMNNRGKKRGQQEERMIYNGKGKIMNK